MIQTYWERRDSGMAAISYCFFLNVYLLPRVVVFFLRSTSLQVWNILGIEITNVCGVTVICVAKICSHPHSWLLCIELNFLQLVLFLTFWSEKYTNTLITVEIERDTS